jgi:hypothetical protein
MECRLWAESVPTRIASGRTGVRVPGRGLLGPLNVDTGRPVALKNALLVQMKTNAPTGPGRQSLQHEPPGGPRLESVHSGRTDRDWGSFLVQRRCCGRPERTKAVIHRRCGEWPIRQLPRLARRRWVGQSPSLRGARRGSNLGAFRLLAVARMRRYSFVQAATSDRPIKVRRPRLPPRSCATGWEVPPLMGLRHRRAAWPEVAWPRDRSRGE